VGAPASPCQVLVIGRARASGQLTDAIGPGRERRLQELLLERACAWAADIAPGAVHVEDEPADVADRVRELLDAGPGPLLVAWPDLPVWRREHGRAALEDLSDGCAVSVGPVFDGGFYLLALAGLVPALFGAPEHVWRGPDAMGRALAAASEAGLEVGLLRAERGLHSIPDVRAALADPLLDPELRGLLARAR
jgi:hypothetical protein